MEQQRNAVGNRNWFSWLFRKSDNNNEPGGHLMPLPEPMVCRTAYEEIWDSVTARNAGIIGIHGEMIGVGLTTLVNYLNNQFIQRPPCHYDYVFVCHLAGSTHTIREKIASQIGISETEDWKYERDFYEKARMLLKALEGKRYVLLMDVMRSHFRPGAIGVPDPTVENECKFIFTTPFEAVCDVNTPDVRIKFKALLEEDSRSLFAQILGVESIDGTDSISDTARQMVDLCFGLPKVLVVVAGLMKSNKTIDQWQLELARMKDLHRELKLGISRFKMDFAEDFYFIITFKRQLAGGRHQIALTSDIAPGLRGEEGKRLLAIRQRAVK